MIDIEMRIVLGLVSFPDFLMRFAKNEDVHIPVLERDAQSYVSKKLMRNIHNIIPIDICKHVKSALTTGYYTGTY